MKKAKDDTSKVNALNSICENMLHDDWIKYQIFQYDLIINTLQTEDSKNITNHFKRKWAAAAKNIGYFHHIQGRFTQALEYYQKSLEVSVELGDKKSVGQSFTNIGNVYSAQGNIKKA